MDSDWLLIGFVLTAFLYFSGYEALGLITLFLILLIFIGSVLFTRGQKVEKSATVLEPIVIESTRGPLYRMPESTEIQYDPEAGMLPLWSKFGDKTGKAFGEIIRCARGQPKKEKKE